MNSEFVSVVIPAYNEERRIERTLHGVGDYLRQKFARFELIVVNDGSSDDTARKIAEAASSLDLGAQFVTLSFPANHGKGFAVRQGVLRARGDFIIFTDADLSTPAEEIEKGLQAVAAGYPVVIASRRHPDSVIKRRQSWARERVGGCFNLLVRMLLRLPFRDTQCGFKCFTREAAREIFTRARSDAFVFDVEVLLLARRLGYPIKEIPITWTDFAGSKVSLRGNAVATFKELLAIYRNARRGLYGKNR